jgi:hypothetical protein
MGKKTYNWCKWHQAWVIHDPTKCTLANKKKENKSNDEHESNEKKLKDLKIDPALSAEIDSDSEGEYMYE